MRSPRIRISGFELSFTEKQWKTIIGIGLGLNNKDIAKVNNIQPGVVRNNIRMIMDKLGLCTREDIALWYNVRKARHHTYLGEPNGK